MSPTFNIFDSLLDNPSVSDSHASSGVLYWAWAVFAIMIVADLTLIGFTMFGKSRNPLFHQLAVIIVTTSTITWYAVAANLGKTSIMQEFHGGTRDVFYVRYIQYFIIWPLSIVLLYLGTGFTLRAIGISVFMAAAFDVCLLVGALVPNAYKWGFYAIGLICMLYAVWHIFLRVGRSVYPSPSGLTSGGYRGNAGMLTFLWLMYPIAWGCSEGGNIITVRSEIIWYGILDLLWAVGWVSYFLMSHRGVNSGTAAAVGAGGHAGYGGEKGGYGNHGSNNGVGAGRDSTTSHPHEPLTNARV